MKNISLIFALVLVSMMTRAEYSCSDGAELACLDKGDKVCPAHTKCVDEAAICFEKDACGSDANMICRSEYDAVLNNHQDTIEQYDLLAAQNVGLREQRLAQKNCVLNASKLLDAQKCVR
jgi:hypothetical protein